MAAMIDALTETAARSGGTGQGDQTFWLLAAQKCVRAAIGTVWLATGGCSLKQLYDAVDSAPTSLQQKDDPTWQQGSFLLACLQEASARAGEAPCPDLDFYAAFWMREWPSLGEKTRSIVHAMVTNVLAKFLIGPVARFASGGGTPVTPDDCLAGKVVVLDWPVLKWREPGRFVQILMKALVQRAALRREVKPETVPVVVWSDECQLFAVPDADAQAQTVARSHRLITVNLTQNLPTLYSALGGTEKARHEVAGYVANHQTKVLCQNTCPETNTACSQLLGHHWKLLVGGSAGGGPVDLISDVLGTAHPHAHASWSQQWHPEVPPDTFVGLAKGGPDNGFLVEAVLSQGGRRFSTGRTWLRVAFPQSRDGKGG